LLQEFWGHHLGRNARQQVRLHGHGLARFWDTERLIIKQV